MLSTLKKILPQNVEDEKGAAVFRVADRKKNRFGPVLGPKGPLGPRLDRGPKRLGFVLRVAEWTDRFMPDRTGPKSFGPRSGPETLTYTHDGIADRIFLFL